MSQVSREDHFVPRFYLVRFTDTGKRKGRLWEFDGAKGTRRQSDPKKVGKEDDYYTVSVQGQAPDLVETLFGKVENLAAEITKSIINNKKLPSSKRERADLFMFIALSYLRSPSHRGFLMDSYSETETMKYRMLLSTPDRWNKYLRWCADRGVAYPGGSYEELVRMYVNEETEVRVSNQSEVHAARIVESLESVFNTLVPRTWHLEISDQSQGFFITSDTPVSAVWTSPADILLGQAWIGSPAAEVVFPLHKRMALIGTYASDSGTVRVDSERVAVVNFATATAAHRYVYGPNDDYVMKSASGRYFRSADWFAWRRPVNNTDA